MKAITAFVFAVALVSAWPTRGDEVRVPEAKPMQQSRSLSGQPEGAQQAQRPLRVDDMFHQERIGRPWTPSPVAFAPVGEALAFLKGRPVSENNYRRTEFDSRFGRWDVWIQERMTSEPFNLTNGESDASSWSGPVWSPDAKYLAMLSTRGGVLKLWIWDRGTGQLRQVSTGEVRFTSLVWLDSTHVVAAIPPRGEVSLFKEETGVISAASEGWAKAMNGREQTSNALESGVAVDLKARPQGQLVDFDVATGRPETLLSADVDGCKPSPNGQFIACLRRDHPYLPRPEEPLRNDTRRGKYAIEVARAGAGPVHFRAPVSADVLSGSLRWTSNSRELLFIGYRESRLEVPDLYRVKLPSGEVTAIGLRDLDPVPPGEQVSPDIEPLQSGDIFLRGALRTDDRPVSPTQRRDWWSLDRQGKSRCVTCSLTDAPGQLLMEDGGTSGVGVSNGKLWRVFASGRPPQNLTGGMGLDQVRIVWPATAMQNPQRDQPVTRVIVESLTDNGESDHLLDLNLDIAKAIVKPAPQASFEEFGPATDSAVYSLSDRTGSYLWRYQSNGQARIQLAAANQFLASISEAVLRPINYMSSNGDALKGWLILPVGYQPGRRYPLLTWVYAGSVYDDSPPSDASIAFAFSQNLQLAAARGFAVLLPSMPLAPPGVIEDPMLRLPEGVLPAVAKAIDLGIADADRLFLAGQSFGGFSTYGLVTQTRRFKAAIASAGLADLTSLYGTFHAADRYGDHPEENLFSLALLETGQASLGSPPWRDAQRYYRNSPISYVDRIQTPLMIVQGDLDYVALQQGEEMFMSLYRQGKRAQFVRYWGEGHVLASPANIRDYWARLYAWFDDFGDITRDGDGELVFDGDRVKSRAGTPALTPKDFLNFSRMFERD